jgi:hypothetical protein
VNCCIGVKGKERIFEEEKKAKGLMGRLGHSTVKTEKTDLNLG